MVKVEEIKLDGLILPTNGIGMVMMQPYVELCKTEPYRWLKDKKANQIKRIIRTLDISKEAAHDCEKTHFTIFPEYSIPGLDGIHTIQEYISDISWEDGTVVIGGVDGLTKNEYSKLCDSANTEIYIDNRPENIRREQIWINSCVIWVKMQNSENESVIKRWVQPKLIPSWPEENIICEDMFEGKCVYVFEGKLHDRRSFRFMTMICFDWIGSFGINNGIFEILHQLNNLPDAAPYGKRIDLCFILQRNKDTYHPSFLSNIYEFFHNHKYSLVDRGKCAVVAVNNSGKHLH